MRWRHPIAQLNPGTRHIYLLPGFDPGGTRTLLRLVRSELAQASPPLKLKSLGQGANAVTFRGSSANDKPPAEIIFLSWDDIVRRRWARHPWQLCWQGLGLYWHYLFRYRTLLTALEEPKASFTFFWPMIFVAGLGLTALGCIIAAAAAPLAPWLRGVLMAIAVGFWIRYGTKEAERRRVDWLFRAINFSCRLTQSEGKDLGSRLDEFSIKIIKSIQMRPADDHVIVGYSSGAYLATKLLFRIHNQLPDGAGASNLQLVTLGQNPAFLASISTVERFREELNTLLDANIPWEDITCKDDWMSFAEVDLARVLKREASKMPEERQASLAEAAELKGHQAIMNNQFLLHFQYFRHAPEFSCLEWILPSSADE